MYEYLWSARLYLNNLIYSLLILHDITITPFCGWENWGTEVNWVAQGHGNVIQKVDFLHTEPQ